MILNRSNKGIYRNTEDSLGAKLFEFSYPYNTFPFELIGYRCPAAIFVFPSGKIESIELYKPSVQFLKKEEAEQKEREKKFFGLIDLLKDELRNGESNKTPTSPQSPTLLA